MSSTVREPRGNDRGSVTAEIAVALPALTLMLGLALGAVDAAATQVACVDSARVGARALARGEEPPRVRELVQQTAPPAAEVVLRTEAAHARVEVRAPVRIGPLPSGVTVHGRALTPLEPVQ